MQNLWLKFVSTIQAYKFKEADNSPQSFISIKNPQIDRERQTQWSATRRYKIS
jgi:hypothetical protein